jgi:hypothetical protein
MATSFAHQLPEIICPQCREQFNIEIWLIVDAAERPDLVEKARDDSIHLLFCPKCDYQGQIDAPLLLYRPGQEPTLIFSPAQGTDESTGQQDEQELLSKLKESLGPAWQNEWLEQAQVVQRSRLPAALSDEFHEQVDDSQEPLQEAQRILREAGELGAALDKGFNVGSADELKEVLEQHPELYSEAGLALLDRLLAVETNPQAKQVLAQRQAFLQRCREAGLAAAFSEEAQSGPISPELQWIIEQLARPGRLSEMPHRIALCELALKMIERAEQPEIWAFLQNTLANALAQNPQGKRA